MDNKIVFGIMNILFNSIGVPSFLVGDKKRGVGTILFGIYTIFIGFIINAIKGIINGIKILKMTDEEFAAADKSSLICAMSGKKKISDAVDEAKNMAEEVSNEEAAE